MYASRYVHVQPSDIPLHWTLQWNIRDKQKRDTERERVFTKGQREAEDVVDVDLHVDLVLGVRMVYRLTHNFSSLLRLLAYSCCTVDTTRCSWLHRLPWWSLTSGICKSQPAESTSILEIENVVSDYCHWKLQKQSLAAAFHVWISPISVKESVIGSLI